MHPQSPQLTESQEIIARAERSAVFVFRIRVAARYLWRRLGPRSFTGRSNGSNGPASPAAEPWRRILSHCLKCALRRTMRVLPAQRPGRVLVPWVLRGRVAPGPHDEVQVVLKEPHPRAA